MSVCFIKRLFIFPFKQFAFIGVSHRVTFVHLTHFVLFQSCSSEKMVESQLTGRRIESLWRHVSVTLI